MPQEQFTSNSPEQTLDFGRVFAERLKAGDVVALVGDLGAGKTVLAQGICQGLGYAGNVTSPSFVHVHEYPNAVPIFHADLYFDQSPQAIASLGLDELMAGDGITLIEWADRFLEVLPADSWKIHIEWTDEDEFSRRITISH